MSEQHDALRASLGPVGAWTFAFDSRRVGDLLEDARGIEQLGYPALWVPEGGGSRDVLSHMALLLDATERITVASGIANITARQPEVLQAGLITLADAFGDRFVPGIGIGHEYTTESRGFEWTKPLARMRTYVDRMDEATDTWPAPAVPPRRLLAALGDEMLRLSAELALGAHTYFVPVEHTARAREVLGPEPVLAVEQGVVMHTDPARARELARGWAIHYLELPNYANNWRRMGYAEDLEGGGSDRLVDAAIAWGDVDAVEARVRAHLDAGADHVCVQIVGDPDEASPVPSLRELAPALLRELH
ncbi:MAG: TIGR03620 family F420-dependent LLM class oxidoreductase [Actinomycetota bacterium]